MKYCGLLLILLLRIVNLKLAGCFKCDFFVDWGRYTCLIKENSIVSEEKHLDKKNDDDVKAYYFYGKNNTKHFTQQESDLICQKFKNLEKFYVNHIKSVDDNLFVECKNLKEFGIGDSELEKISENLFFYQSGLQEISLSNNKLRTLPEIVFLNQRELVELYLNYNLISCLPPNIFKSLTKLRFLALTRNQIQSLNPKWFETLQLLTFLRLNDNKIQDLPKNVFVHLKNLEYLYLAGNQLTTIHSDSFGILRNLSYIDLKNNKINSIDAKFFDNTGFRFFDMRGNVCSNEHIVWRNVIKEDFSNCTSRYLYQHKLETFTNSDCFSDPNECGISQYVQHAIINGKAVNRGEYPWNVALIDESSSLFCGGTLVSNRHVISAAHCIKGKQDSHIFGIEDFSILLGVHNHSNSIESGRISVNVRSIHIHPDWNMDVEMFDADIAILELESDVQFTNLIKPICIADQDSDIAEATQGTVVGFGFTEKREISNIAKKLEVPIYNYHNCTKHNKDQLILLSANTFCAGPADGRGVCSGDSGSGVYVLHSRKYYLRGLVSATLMKSAECDVNKTAVFTDVTKYYGWIIQKIPIKPTRVPTTTVIQTPKKGFWTCLTSIFTNC